MARRIPQSFIDELLRRVDLVEVVRLRRDGLKKSGSDHYALCPFHDEKTPSFSVSETKQLYHCFGCEAGGDAIGFVMAYEGLTFPDAVGLLADSVGMSVPMDEHAAAQAERAAPLHDVLERAQRVQRDALAADRAASRYAASRGLAAETLERFGIGFAPDDWNWLERAVPNSRDPLLDSGMLAPGKEGRGPYPRFRGRLMFPIRDGRGRLIAFGGRSLGAVEPKYMNSPETALFHKGRELYGLFEAARAIRERGSVIVVEGYMDVVMLAQSGIENVVATLGTSVTPEHIAALHRIVPDIVFAFDGDRAGRKAAGRALRAVLPALEDGRDAAFVFLPDGHDPDSLVLAEGEDRFRERLADSEDVVDVLLSELSPDGGVSGLGAKARLAAAARPLLGTMPDGVYRRLAVQAVERRVGVPLDAEPSETDQAVAAERTLEPPAAPDPVLHATVMILRDPDLVATLPADVLQIDDRLPGAEQLLYVLSLAEVNPEAGSDALIARLPVEARGAAERLVADARASGREGEGGEDARRTELRDALASLAPRSASRAGEQPDE